MIISLEMSFSSPLKQQFRISLILLLFITLQSPLWKPPVQKLEPLLRHIPSASHLLPQHFSANTVVWGTTGVSLPTHIQLISDKKHLRFLKSPQILEQLTTHNTGQLILAQVLPFSLLCSLVSYTVALGHHIPPIKSSHLDPFSGPTLQETRAKIIVFHTKPIQVYHTNLVLRKFILV